LRQGFGDLIPPTKNPFAILMLEPASGTVDVNIHPTKREIRFRDERAAHDAVRDAVRDRLAAIESQIRLMPRPAVVEPTTPTERWEEDSPQSVPDPPLTAAAVSQLPAPPVPPVVPPEGSPQGVQVEFGGVDEYGAEEFLAPEAMYRPVSGIEDAPLQVFDTYLVVPEGDRLLIIDQHALHERLTFDELRSDLEDHEYAAQQLAVPLLVDVPPSHVKLLESHIGLFAGLGIHIEPFGGNTFQVTAVCHLYDDSRVPDIIYRVLDEIAQGDLFDREDLTAALLRLTVEACRSSVKAGDRLTREERRSLLDGFRRLRPPYTCPHGRPIITEITQHQMEKSFRRIQ
jgi:DNA mismatch repair protein MutL